MQTAQTLRVEAARIAFLLERDGDAATLVWVKRPLGIYRRAVLDHGIQNERTSMNRDVRILVARERRLF